ncbi:hypothetical protein PVAND_008135 [Polypedilum vanderplanki]|uniref:Uncharacterized protein n=1 Tax=Polypedilum vanderplanki TaxID=319348 RepID=A0A9J6C924_POLVA|nr:hypothetical protein PVAND_008135 [Polypedilum vanderplanki]
MICNILKFNKLSNLQKSFAYFSTQVAKKEFVNFQDEWENARSFDEIPQPSKISLIRAFLPGGKYYKLSLIDMHRSMNKEYGTMVKFPEVLGRRGMVCSYNVEDVEKLFRHEGQTPYRRTLETLHHYRKKYRPEVYEEYGGLFTEQGESWYKMRTIANPVLLQPKTIKQYIPQVDDVSKEFIKMIVQKLDANNECPENFSDYLNLWSLESIANISLDRRLGIVSGNYQDEMAERLIKSIRQFFVEVYEFEVNMSVWKYYETKAFKNLMNLYDELTNIILHYVEKAIEDIQKKTIRNDKEESILEKLLKINKNAAIVMTADALLAGVDTTSSATIGILYCLAKNQDKQNKLREELKSILRNENDELTPKNMQNMPYLRACIKEGFRLYPPTVGTVRKADQDLVLSGYKIPKGTEVVMPIALFQKDCYTRANEFIPERWLKEILDTNCPHAKEASPFSYLPFGFGSRVCIGKRLANLEMEVLITRLIRDYKIEWNYPELKFKVAIVNIPDGALKFKITKI